MRPRRNPDDTSDGGFTLIELMVVVLIIAVLLAIAIPTFVGARQRAADRAVQSNVRNAFTATRVYYTDKLYYSSSPAEMTAIEPSLQWTNAGLDSSAATNTISIVVFDQPSTAQTVIVGGRTTTGRCYFLKDVMGGANSGTYFNSNVIGGASCATPDPTDPAWANSWG